MMCYGMGCVYEDRMGECTWDGGLPIPCPTQEDKMEEYSVEWFKWHRDNHAEWLGTQALKLLEHYVELETEMERLREAEEPNERV